MGKQLPYLRATDRELQGKALSSTVGVVSSVFTLFILTTYATTNTATANWAFYLLQLHTMAFPLVAMILIVEMKIEYVFREWMYYNLLDEGVLLDFEDEETLVQFLRTSWIGWYICGSVFILFVTVATFLQIGAMFTVLTMSAGLMNSIYAIRQLEVNLVSVNKFVERDPKACSAFLADICRDERIVSSRELQLFCTMIKAAHAAVDYEIQGKDRAQERDAAHRKLVDEGAVLDFVKLGQGDDAAENNEGEKDDGDAAENNKGDKDEVTFSLESVNETLAKFTLWQRYKHSLVLTRWATGVNFFVHEQDREFARVIGRIRVMCTVMTLLVEIYGFYALSTGAARCTTKEA